MATASPENPYIVNLADIYGSILVGTHVSSALWGISCMQMFLYFFNYSKDRTFLKAFVAFLWVAGTTSQILILMSPWDVLILHWGSLATLSRPNIYLVNHVPVAGIIIFVVQIFYLHRIYLLGGKKWRYLVGFLAILTVFGLVTTIPLVVWDNNASDLNGLHSRRVLVVEGAVRAAPALVDIIISLSMVYLLTRGKRPGFRSTSSMIYRLTIITINCGVWTALIALVDFILAAGVPSSFAYTSFELCVTSLYINSLMANLNSREYARGNDIEFNSYHTRGNNIALQNVFRKGPGSGDAQTVSTKETGVTIRVDTDTAVSGDSLHGGGDKDTLTDSRDKAIHIV